MRMKNNIKNKKAWNVNLPNQDIKHDILSDEKDFSTIKIKSIDIFYSE
jgi:hypothetical protein